MCFRDTAGQERYRTITKQYYRKGQVSTSLDFHSYSRMDVQ